MANSLHNYIVQVLVTNSVRDVECAWESHTPLHTLLTIQMGNEPLWVFPVPIFIRENWFLYMHAKVVVALQSNVHPPHTYTHTQLLVLHPGTSAKSASQHSRKRVKESNS